MTPQDTLGRPAVAPGVAAGNRGPVPGTLGRPAMQSPVQQPGAGQPGRPAQPPPLAPPSAVPAVQPPIPPPSSSPAQPAGPEPSKAAPGATLGQPAAPPAAVLSRVPSQAEFDQMGPGATAQTPYGQMVAGADGQAKVVLDEAGKAAFVQARAKALGDFGQLPTWAAGPGAPPPPVEVGRPNFNPLTGLWSGEQNGPAVNEVKIRQDAPPPVDAAPPSPSAIPPHGGGFQAGPPPSPSGGTVMSGALGPEVKPVAVDADAIARRRAAAMLQFTNPSREPRV